MIQQAVQLGYYPKSWKKAQEYYLEKLESVILG